MTHTHWARAANGNSALRQKAFQIQLQNACGTVIQSNRLGVNHASHPETATTHEGAVMATKRVSPGKKTTRRKAATAAAELTDGAAMGVLESAPSVMVASTGIDPDVRRQLVAADAYFRAERRGFAAGNELDDWVAAEMAVDMRLRQTQVA